jgi:hypothetical protein
MDGKWLKDYSLGPDWFKEGVDKARKEFDEKRQIIYEKYVFKDPNNGKILLIDGKVHLSKGAEKKYTNEMSEAVKKYDEEINLLKDKLFIYFSLIW